MFAISAQYTITWVSRTTQANVKSVDSFSLQVYSKAMAFEAVSPKIMPMFWNDAN